MDADALGFRAAPEVLALGVTGAYLVISGLDNRAPHPELDRHCADVAARVRDAGAPERVRTDPVLEGFRALHTKVGCSNRTFVASPEGLLRMVHKRGAPPRVSPVVDAYNSVSLETRLALGAHDVAAIEGGVTLRLTDGSERFVPLGADAPRPVGPGEYAYVDDGNEVICRLEVRQVEKTKVTADTVDCFYIVQGNERTPRDLILEAVDRLVSLTRRHCGGRERVLWTP